MTTSSYRVFSFFFLWHFSIMLLQFSVINHYVSSHLFQLFACAAVITKRGSTRCSAWNDCKRSLETQAELSNKSGQIESDSCEMCLLWPSVQQQHTQRKSLLNDSLCQNRNWKGEKWKQSECMHFFWRDRARTRPCWPTEEGVKNCNNCLEAAAHLQQFCQGGH